MLVVNRPRAPPVPPKPPLTVLANEVQPFIRYDLGDCVRFNGDSCPCGSPFRSFQVEGRQATLVRVGKVQTLSSRRLARAQRPPAARPEQRPQIVVGSSYRDSIDHFGKRSVIWNRAPQPSGPLSGLSSQ